MLSQTARNIAETFTDAQDKGHIIPVLEAEAMTFQSEKMSGKLVKVTSGQTPGQKPLVLDTAALSELDAAGLISINPRGEGRLGIVLLPGLKEYKPPKLPDSTWAPKFHI